jgi:hypothetical protein
MEGGLGPNEGCGAKRKKNVSCKKYTFVWAKCSVGKIPGAQVVSTTFKMLMVTNETFEAKMTNGEWGYKHVYKILY